MYLKTCFAMVLLGLALTQAGPAPKVIEKKSLAENTDFEKKADVKTDETGFEKDRSKKSTTFCVHIRPGADQATQTTCNDGATATTHSQAFAKPQTTMNVMPAAQQQMIYSVAPPQVFQSIPPMQILQPAPQHAHASSIVQPIPQPTVVQPAPEQKPQPIPAPTPTVEIMENVPKVPSPAQVVFQPPQPLPEPQETMSMLPISPVCNEQMYAFPSSPLVFMPPEEEQLATVVQMPSQPCTNPLHNYLAQCTCSPRNMAYLGSDSGMGSLHALAMRERSMGPFFDTRNRMMPAMAYPSASFTKSPVMIGQLDSRIVSPYAARISSPDAEAKKPEGRTNFIHVHNVPASVHQTPSSYHKHIHTVEAGAYPAATYTSYPGSRYISVGQIGHPGITINAYPYVNTGAYRSASTENQPTYKLADESGIQEYDSTNSMVMATEDLAQTPKFTREIDATQAKDASKEAMKKD